MITKQEESVGYLFAMGTKGGEGSGNFGHAGVPGEIGGSASGGSGGGGRKGSIAPDRIFMGATLPLRSKLKFGDQVVYKDKDNKPVVGVVAYGGKDVNPKTHIAVESSRGVVIIPREHLRMPKGGFRTRGE